MYNDVKNGISHGFNIEDSHGFPKEPDRIITQFTSQGKGVRILRPWELKAIVKAIPKKDYKIKFEALLYSGCRYVELKALHNQPELFNDKWRKIVSTGDFIASGRIPHITLSVLV